MTIVSAYEMYSLTFNEAFEKRKSFAIESEISYVFIIVFCFFLALIKAENGIFCVYEIHQNVSHNYSIELIKHILFRNTNN